MTPDLLSRTAQLDRTPVRNGPYERFLARVLAASLDRKLASGHLPRSSNCLAVRAQYLVSPAGRSELARRWLDVLALAGMPPVPRTPRGPLCRGAVADGEHDVREMIAILAGTLPIAARGAAVASWLLRDGTGPLHNHRSALDLGCVVQEAIRQMDTFADGAEAGLRTRLGVD
jgi:hypothetical protein